MALNKDMVFSTCDKLFSDGTAPTLINIRTILGEGSYSTISKFLAEWKTASRTAPTEVEFDEVPEEITGLFTGPIASVWSAALREANKLYQEEKDEFVARLADARNETEQALASLDAQAASMDVIGLDLKIKKADCVELHDDLLKSREQLTTANAQVNTLQAAYDRLLMTINIQPGIPPASEFELALTPNLRKRVKKSPAAQ